MGFATIQYTLVMNKKCFWLSDICALSHSTTTKWHSSNSSNTIQKSYSDVEIQQCRQSVYITITPYSTTTLINKQFAGLSHPLATICRALQITSIHCIQGRHVIMWLVVMHFPAHKGKNFSVGSRNGEGGEGKCDIILEGGCKPLECHMPTLHHFYFLFL